MKEQEKKAPIDPPFVIYERARQLLEDAEASGIDIIGFLQERRAGGQQPQAEAPNEDVRAPVTCARCERLLTDTPEELAKHIDDMVVQMGNYSLTWPLKDFRARLDAELAPGDRVISIGHGRIVVERRNGSQVTLYRLAS